MSMTSYEPDWDASTEPRYEAHLERVYALREEDAVSVRTTMTEGTTALYDSTTGVAFGPVFDSEADAVSFLEHLTEIGERDPRVIPAAELAELAREFLQEAS